tara:strand:- start:1258 stop:2223 length:966 start_codon:yes stop_codon:yes gene_type:complete
MVNKKIVLNVCGVKSLGGLKLFLESFDFLAESGSKLIVLYSELPFYKDLQNQFIDSELVKFYYIKKKRYLHPYLNIFLNKDIKSIINSSDAIIHYGNFGFKTKIKSFILIQNILPLVKNDVRNLLLRYFIIRSSKDSDHILVQLNHLKNYLPIQDRNKIIEIGEIVEKSVPLSNKNGRIVCFASEIPNKNFEFILKVLNNISNNNLITIINPKNNIQEFNCVKTSNNEETMKLLSENEIYFHASDFETVGLPLYEAQELGLKVVAPSSPYTQYFDKDSTFLYESNNVNDAVDKIHKATKSSAQNIKALNYSENWAKVLRKI